MTADSSKKKKPNRLLMAALPVALTLGGGWVWLDSGRYESTENAAIQQARIPVASEISGRVTEVYVTDSQHVTKATPLFRVDPQPYELALAEADAALAEARARSKRSDTALGELRESIRALRAELNKP